MEIAQHCGEICEQGMTLYVFGGAGLFGWLVQHTIRSYATNVRQR